MYERFFGLNARPFELTPDPRFLFLTARHAEALAHLEYGLSGRKGITVLIGEVGTGKTTLLRAAIDRLSGASVLCAHVANPTLTRGEFYELLTAEFHLSEQAATSKAQFLIELGRLVRERHEQGMLTALIVDEAQALPFELLEEIRLLANLESETEKLMQVLLVGQPELAQRLNEPELRQLKQRIALRCSLEPMTLRETASYIAGRIRIAGGDAPKVFTRDAVQEIYERTKGIPRLVSVVCDNALVTGFANGVAPVDRQVIVGVCRDFDFGGMPERSTQDGAPEIATVMPKEPEPVLEAESPQPSEQKIAEPKPASSAMFSLFGKTRSGGRG